MIFRLHKSSIASYVRPFSTTVSRLTSVSKPHPSLSYYHLHPVTNGPRPFAVSFLSANDLPDSKAISDFPDLIIGYTPELIEPKTFVDNPAFVDFMTKVLNEKLHHINDPMLKSLADWQKEGWLHIADERNPPPWGRIPFPEDIIGTVLVKNGVIQSRTYQAMPTHRVVSSKGIFQLPEKLRLSVTDATKKVVEK